MQEGPRACTSCPLLRLGPRIWNSQRDEALNCSKLRVTSRLNALPPSQAGMGRWRCFFFSKNSSQILPFCIGAGVQQISRVELIPHCIITVYKEGIIWHVSAIYFTVLAAVVHTNEHGWVLFSPPCEMKAETPAVNGFPKGSRDAGSCSNARCQQPRRHVGL